MMRSASSCAHGAMMRRINGGQADGRSRWRTASRPWYAGCWRCGRPATGGWEDGRTPDRFARYCERVTRHLGDLIGAVCTLNDESTKKSGVTL